LNLFETVVSHISGADYLPQSGKLSRFDQLNFGPPSSALAGAITTFFATLPSFPSCESAVGIFLF
jgi:hypothetical protein